MKKSILILTIALTTVSCKKSHTCKCDNYYGSNAPAPLPGTYVGTDDETITDTKAHAKKTCEAKSLPNNGTNLIYSTCTLQN